MTASALRQRVFRWLRFIIAFAAHHSGLDALYRRLSGAGLVVLMLHRLRDDHDPYPLSMRKASFTLLVGWLRRRRMLVSLDDGVARLADSDSGINYAITFDDGYKDNLGLLDIGDEVVPAVIYVATGHVGGEPIWAYRLQHAVETRTQDVITLDTLGLGEFDLSCDEERSRLYSEVPEALKQLKPAEVEAAVDEIVASVSPEPGEQAADMLDWPDITTLIEAGISIGAHTRHHVLLGRVDDATARSEVIGSYKDIVAGSGVAPRHFSYPNGGEGDFGERDIALVRSAGFSTAVTSIEGINRHDVDVLRIQRHNVHEERYQAPDGTLSEALFFSETSGLLGWLRARRAA